MAKSSGLKRREIRRPNGSKLPAVLRPAPTKKSFNTSVDYKYFEGHVTPDIARQLPSKDVYCWKDERIYTPSQCSIFKFWQLRRHCKRCPLFQEDDHAAALKELIVEWERDEFILLDGKN